MITLIIIKINMKIRHSYIDRFKIRSHLWRWLSTKQWRGRRSKSLWENGFALQYLLSTYLSHNKGVNKEDKNTERQEPEDGKNDGVYQQYEHHKLNQAPLGGICFLDRTVWRTRSPLHFPFNPVLRDHLGQYNRQLDGLLCCVYHTFPQASVLPSRR